MHLSADVIVVGAGALGLSVAWRCAQRGMSVTVLDRGAPGAEATCASAGILSPTEPSEWTGVLGSFNRAAIAAWAQFAAELEAAAGTPSGYEARGELRLLRQGSDATFVDAAERGAEAFGLACERLTEQELRGVEPGVAAGSTALLLPGAAAVNTGEMTGALVEACARAGVGVVAGTEVAEVSGGTHARVRLAGGAELQAGHAVISAGAWSPALLPACAPPVRPVLGESVVLAMEETPPCRLAIRSADGAVVPRRDGTLWMGTTLEERGFVRRPRAGAVHDVIANARAFLPGVAGLGFLGTHAGLRPGTPDGLPVVGASGVESVTLVTGHGREGVMHAPLTAELVAEALATGRWPGETLAFAPTRFSAGTACA